MNGDKQPSFWHYLDREHRMICLKVLTGHSKEIDDLTKNTKEEPSNE